MSDEACGCGCICSGQGLPALWNRPGLAALSYRIRTQPQSFAALMAALDEDARAPGSPLAPLTVRQLDDPTIALADALACVMDVLSFYDERILNEGYLRTASERASLLDLARQIGYELRPGVAASAYLSFQAEGRIPSGADATPDPSAIDVPAGTSVQSLPTGGALPQTFETGSDLAAWVASNRIPARRWAEQKLDPTAKSIILSGTGLRLSAGDMLLLAADPDAGAVTAAPSVARVLTIVENQANAWTTVTLEHAATATATVTSAAARAAIAPRPAFRAGTGVFTAVEEQLTSQEQLAIAIEESPWSLGVILATWGLGGVGAAADLGAPPPGVFALRQHATVFGHNAQPYVTLPAALRPPTDKAPYPTSWDDNPVAVADDSSGTPLDPFGARIDLDARYPKLVPGSWIALTSQGLGHADAFWVQNVQELARADYAMAATVTSLLLAKTASAYTPNVAGLGDATRFSVRNTAVWAQSEQLALADVPIAKPVSDAVVDLEGLVLDLAPGATIILTGEPTDAIGAVISEAATVIAVDYGDPGGLKPRPYTRLTLAATLEHKYTRSSVTVDANVVEATHGMTVNEVLGSSDGSANQAFTLRQKPMTYVTAATAGGVASSLVVRVQGVEWEEVPFFYGSGPSDRRFIVRREDDGTAHVLFGDGTQGAIPPPGAHTITATYRVGIGTPRLVRAGALTLMAKRPPGIATVLNPLAAGGAADPESRDGARGNAPITVLTLDRAVSHNDYGDYARSFAGIAKATASELWRGEDRVIAITLAAADRSTVSLETPIGKNLIASIEANHEPGTRVVITSFLAVPFVLGVELVIDADYDAPAVISAVSALLAAAYAFEAAQFATPIRVSAIVARVLTVAGVIDAHVTALAPAGAPEGTVADPLYPADASWTDVERLAVGPAQLLTLVPTGPAVVQRA